MSTNSKLFDSLFNDIFSAEMSNYIKPSDTELYEERPVDIIEFIESPNYLNLSNKIYTPNKYIFSQIIPTEIREIGLLLGKGVGKTTISAIFLLYGAYISLCLKDPQKYYKLLPGTNIVYLLVSTSEKQAKTVCFALIKELLRASPYFRGKFEDLATEIRFNKNIIILAGHSGSTTFLGMATHWAVMDELEWHQESLERSVSSNLYRALKGSMITRFPDKYKLLMVSSPNTEFGFLYSRYKFVQSHGSKVDFPDFHINEDASKAPSDYKYWEEILGPQEVDFLHSLNINAYAQGDTYFVNGPTWKIKPGLPVEAFYQDFVQDNIGATRDFAAQPLNSSNPFFKDPGLLDRRAITYGYEPINHDTLIISDFLKPNPSGRYFFAGDLSVSGDRTGIAMCHYDFGTNKVVLDFALPIIARRNERVDYSIIRQLIFNLRDRGFNLRQILFDQFQSSDSINILINAGFDAQQVNYAESFVGCTSLHELISTDRLVYASEFEVFIGEAKELQVVNSKRIDHLLSSGYYNSKDVWDAVVNCVSRCLEDFYQLGNKDVKIERTGTVLDRLIKQQEDEDILDNNWLFN